MEKIMRKITAVVATAVMVIAPITFQQNTTAYAADGDTHSVHGVKYEDTNANGVRDT